MQIGAPMDLYHHPANLFVAGFIGSPRMNFLEVEVESVGSGEVRITSRDIGEVKLDTAVAFSAGEKVILGIRPQYLSLADDKATPKPGQARLTGSVQLVERLGTETIINLRLPTGASLIGALGGDQPAALNSEVVLSYELSQAHLFARE